MTTHSEKYTIYTIGIMALTNIPGSNEAIKITYDSFSDGTRVVGEYSPHPFFMDEIAYPYAILSKLTRREMLAFFFHEPTFISTISTHLKKISPEASTLYCNEIKKYNMDDLLTDKILNENKEPKSGVDPINKMQIAICNLWCMIRLLFPTEFPVSCNVASSFLNYIKSKPILNNSFSSAPIINMAMFMKTAPINATIKIENNTYTVAKTIWLDDMINHPIYTKLITDYSFLIQWCANQKPINAKAYTLLQKQIDTNIKILQNNTDNIVSENETFMKPPTTESAASRRMMYSNNTDAADYIIEKIKIVFTIQDQTNLKNVAKSFNDIIDKIIIDAENTVNTICEIEEVIGLDGKSSKDSLTKRSSVEFDVEMEALDDIFAKMQSNRQSTSLSSKMNKHLTLLHQLIKKYRTLIYVNKTYLDGIINASFKNDNKLTPELMKAAEIPIPFYPEYVAWIESVKKITTAAQDSPMINPILAKMFMSFIEEADINNSVGTIKEQFNSSMKLAMNLLNNTKIINDKDQPFKNLFIGINRLPFADKSKLDYELHISLDLIGGIITADNRGNTECRYKDASIGDYIENAATVNPNIARPARFFIKTQDVATTSYR